MKIPVEPFKAETTLGAIKIIRYKKDGTTHIRGWGRTGTLCGKETVGDHLTVVKKVELISCEVCRMAGRASIYMAEITGDFDTMASLSRHLTYDKQRQGGKQTLQLRALCGRD